MPTAIIDGLKVNYHVQGSGPHLLVLAPGGFNSTIERWRGSGVWKEMDALETLSKTFTVIAYDRREAGLSGGRVEKLTWEVFAKQGHAILDHLGVQYQTVDVLQDQEIRGGIKEYSDWPTVPQLYVKGEFVGGSDIMMEMFESGELKQLVEGVPLAD